MPAIFQIKMNATCCALDIMRGDWHKLCFHFSGLCRGIGGMFRK